MGIFHPHLAALHAPYLPRGVTQQEHVTGQAFDGEVFVDGADKSLLWVQNDVVVGVIRDCSSAGHSSYGSAAPSLYLQVDAISMEISPTAALSEGKPVREDFHHVVEFLPGQFSVRIGVAAQGK